MQTIAHHQVHGTHESNGLVNGLAYHKERQSIGTYLWNHPGIKITRLRLVSDPGFPVWDVSYCHGQVFTNGVWEDVDVCLPFSQIPKYNLKGFILEWARKERVYAKGTGILDDGIISKLC